MPTLYPSIEQELRARPLHWLVTGGAGFIGSHLVERLLSLGQRVRVLDNFLTGLHSNLNDVRKSVGDEAFARFELLEADIADEGVAAKAAQGIDRVLHQAALGSVPRSVKEPMRSHRINVQGFLELLEACRAQGIARVVFASSSSVYGDAAALPKFEGEEGRILSPYAATKAMNELWAQAYASCYPMSFVGLRYFNVFGPRQRPDGPYAAVIPAWIDCMRAGHAPLVHGDGGQSRDFTPIELVVQTNITAACKPLEGSNLLAINVALGGRISLNELEAKLRAAIQELRPKLVVPPAEHGPPRAGDIRHSQADTSALAELLGGIPELDVDGTLKALCDQMLAD